MNREEIAEVVVDALTLIGCKHTYYPITKENKYPSVILHNPVGWFFRVFNFFNDTKALKFNYQDESGQAKESSWHIKTLNYVKWIVAELMCRISKLNRKTVTINLDTKEEATLSLGYWSVEVQGEFWQSALLEITGKNVNIKTADKDLVPAARALLLGDCPDGVFLDLLCEKYEHINSLRYEVAQ